MLTPKEEPSISNKLRNPLESTASTSEANSLFLLLSPSPDLSTAETEYCPVPYIVNGRKKSRSTTIWLAFIKKPFENTSPAHLTVSNKLSLKLEPESPDTESLNFPYFGLIFFPHNKATVPLLVFLRTAVIIFWETLENCSQVRACCRIKLYRIQKCPSLSSSTS